MSVEDFLQERQSLTASLINSPYDAQLYLKRSKIYESLGYPDLAAGDAYKALLLVDEIEDASGEYHEQALSAFQEDGKLEDVLSQCYQILITSLNKCGCPRSAYDFGVQGERRLSQGIFTNLQNEILQKYQTPGENQDDSFEVSDLPNTGLVRRELYPWNEYEPDRNSDDYVSALNEQLKEVAPKCKVKVTELPVLTGGIGVNKQLGLFAKNDIAPGEIALQETSLLTANNQLHDALCDACSAELPELKDGEFWACPDCDDIIFCSQKCLDSALESYHPAICGRDIDSVARDTDPKEAADALYFLLVARAIAMSETQNKHPLRLKEVSPLWGDFLPTPTSSLEETKPSLTFSFTYNILYPLHILTQMDLDIYATTPSYDFWILNTMFAKFRGVASGRPNRRTGKPEVCAVHPLWCLANHSCSPNVIWEWSGDIKLTARTAEQIVLWGEKAGLDEDRNGGIKAGEEIMNHYCDINLPVGQRREWAAGPLGGDCMCERCVWEAKSRSE
jgi:hypothetical protein